LPLVSTGLPNIVSRPGIISCASTASEWIHQIESLLEKDSDFWKKKRHELAMENTWQNRAHNIFSLLSGYAAGKIRYSV